MDLETIERRRIAALVAADVALAGPFHAEDFQFISILGSVLTKDSYLAAVGAGVIRYLVWDPGVMVTRVKAGFGAVRYRARLENVIAGVASPLQHVWQTHLYEERESGWQAVWSQATEIRPPPPPA